MAEVTVAPSTRGSKTSVVIVGAGFAGLYCAQKLGRRNLSITLIDRRNFHLFQPLLYQVATGSLSSGDIASPIRTEFADQDNVTVLQAEVTGFDVERKLVELQDADAVTYDYLVVATGSHHHYFGKEEWEPLAPGLKTLEDALEMRSRILHAFEEAERAAKDQARSTAALTFIIVGGGPTGVELAGTIGELAHLTMRGEFRNIDPRKARIILVENDDRVLPMYDRPSSDKAGKYLEQLGVELKLGYKVTDVTAFDAELTGLGKVERIPCRTVLWAAGNKASPLGKALAERTAATTDRAGRVTVNEFLNIPEHPDIFVLGDMALSTGADGKPLPGIAPVAMQQGKYTAQEITRRMKGKAPEPFKYFNKGSLAVVGRNRAVAERGSLHFGGFVAWLMWAFIHIAYLIEFQNRVVVMLRWAINYFSRKRGARLITGEGLPAPQVAEPSGVHPEQGMPADPQRHTI